MQGWIWQTGWQDQPNRASKCSEGYTQCELSGSSTTAWTNKGKTSMRNMKVFPGRCMTPDTVTPFEFFFRWGNQKGCDLRRLIKRLETKTLGDPSCQMKNMGTNDLSHPTVSSNPSGFAVRTSWKYLACRWFARNHSCNESLKPWVTPRTVRKKQW